jgi:hypothetical protein
MHEWHEHAVCTAAVIKSRGTDGLDDDMSGVYAGHGRGRKQSNLNFSVLAAISICASVASHIATAVKAGTPNHPRGVVGVLRSPKLALQLFLVDHR